MNYICKTLPLTSIRSIYSDITQKEHIDEINNIIDAIKNSDIHYLKIDSYYFDTDNGAASTLKTNPAFKCILKDVIVKNIDTEVYVIKKEYRYEILNLLDALFTRIRPAKHKTQVVTTRTFNPIEVLPVNQVISNIDNNLRHFKEHCNKPLEYFYKENDYIDIQNMVGKGFKDIIWKKEFKNAKSDNKEVNLIIQHLIEMVDR